MPYTSAGLSKQCSHNFDPFRIDLFIAGGLACLVDLPVRRGRNTQSKSRAGGASRFGGCAAVGAIVRHRVVPPVIASICAGQAHSALCDSSVVSQNGDAGEPTEDARKNMPDLAATGA